MAARSDNAIVAADPRGDVVVFGPSSYTPVAAAPAAAPTEQPNLLKMLHANLRGRYPIVIVLSLLAMIAGGIGGYMFGKPMYRTDAYIHVRSSMPIVLYREQMESSMGGNTFNNFVSTQASLVRHERVIAGAVNSDEWRELGRGNLPDDMTHFRKSLRVETSRDSPEMIAVTFTDPEAKASKVAVDLVLKQYETIFGNGQEIEEGRRRALEEVQRTNSGKITTLREEIRRDAAEHGTDDLTQLHAMYMQQLIALRARIIELDVQLASVAPVPGTAPTEETSAKPASEKPTDASIEEIAVVDALMNEYLTRRRQMEGNVAALLAQGLLPGHSDVKRLQSEIESLNGIINQYATMWNQTRVIRPQTTAGGGAAAMLQSPEQMRAQLESLKSAETRLQETVVNVGNKRLAIEAKQREIAAVQALYDDATRRLAQLDVESKASHFVTRIQVIYPEQIPSSPTVDPRKKLAVMGGGAGGALVFALALLVGFIDRRCRYSDELNQAVDGKLLACLPMMANATDQEDSIAAVHNLHRVRAQMQIVSAEQRTIAVTSANAGDGKTSLCLSLGISFAGVGHRTLLIDLDLVGHGLSSRMHMCDGPGTLEALAAGSVEGLVRRCHVEGLHVLPVGNGVDASPARLRPGEIQRLFRHAAAMYDTILVDTGPLLGSLEANFVCSSADAVLLVVGRGQSRVLVKRAVQQIRDINAKLLGVIFNKARDSDFRNSSVSQSVRSIRSVNASKHGAQSKDRPAAGNIDPLADAVFVDGQSFAEEPHVDGRGTAAPRA